MERGNNIDAFIHPAMQPYLHDSQKCYFSLKQSIVSLYAEKRFIRLAFQVSPQSGKLY